MHISHEGQPIPLHSFHYPRCQGLSDRYSHWAFLRHPSWLLPFSPTLNLHIQSIPLSQVSLCSLPYLLTFSVPRCPHHSILHPVRWISILLCIHFLYQLQQALKLKEKKSILAGATVLSRHILPGSAWVFSGDSSFLPHPKDAAERWVHVATLSQSGRVWWLSGPVKEGCLVQCGSHLVLSYQEKLQPPMTLT